MRERYPPVLLKSYFSVFSLLRDGEYITEDISQFSIGMYFAFKKREISFSRKRSRARAKGGIRRAESRRIKTKKEIVMATSTRERGMGARGQEGTEQGAEEMQSLLLAALMSRRSEEEREEGIQNPVLLAALMAARKHEERTEEIEPLVLAALMGIRKEQEKTMA
jgi:hypothetical protein